MKHRNFLLSNPRRLVVDLEQANLSVSLPKLDPNNRHLSSVRSGNPSGGILRLVFDLKKQVKINSFVLTPNELYGHRLVIDLLDDAVVSEASAPAAANSTIDSADTATATETAAVDEVAQGNTPSAPASRNIVKSDANMVTKPFTIAIDAGHGGDDPGAIGHRGTHEKKLTFSIAKRLQDRINRDPNMRAILVRTGDYYIKLHERRYKAKKFDADVFISIHADAFGKKSASGMSVFALSQKGATSAMAQALADKENASDLIGGVSLANKDDILAKVLVDLSMTNTISESVNLGGRVLRELGRLGKLHSRRVEQASFAVLKTPDMPSILVETGFITNPEEERRLRTSSYQIKLANAIYTALDDYYQQTPYASKARYNSPSFAASQNSTRSTRNSAPVKYGRHKVVRGDSLSTIAQRYGISVRELKRLNKIKHNTAMLGVRLKVPVRSQAPAASSQSKATTKPLVHIVRRGDSLSKISARYNVTIKSLKRVNGLKKNTVFLGQKIKVPGRSTAVNKPKATVKHTVKRGDTLSEIAEKYRSTVSKIKKANKLRSNTVQLGQVLTIPQ